MILEVLFWLILAYLVGAVIWRLIQRGRGAAVIAASASSPIGRLFGRGWVAPAAAAVLLIGVSVLKYGPGLTGVEWTDAEQVELEHFTESVTLYRQAFALSQAGRQTREDWESVNAMLQASLAEAEQVSDDVLTRLDPELKAMYRDKFIAGLKVGSYGLSHYTAAPQKGSDTLEHHREDSLSLGRSLFEEWNQWFALHQKAINHRLN